MIVCALALIAALHPGVSGAQPAHTATEQRFDALSAPRAAPSATATLAPTAIPAINQAPSMPQSGLERAVVTSVVDGDTLDATINRRTRRIRWIGVDTPETTHPARPVV
jgi:micrococcal nuclease